MNDNAKTSRRDFMKTTATGAPMLAVGGVLPGFDARSYQAVVGANEKIRMGGIGIHSRGLALAANFAKQKNCVVNYLCDVDSRALATCGARIAEVAGNSVKTEKDVRKMVESKDFDAVFIATPDHWHAMAAILAMRAGKDVYLEKPCCYSPAEGEMLIQAEKKYRRVLQVGNQRRSWPNVVQGMQELKEGAIGRPYFAKAWYANRRLPIGVGKATAVPDWLDWDLWQGPAPRVAYKDNIVHYNWHWFWHWGLGEALANGVHCTDLMRWGLGVDYPTLVTSVGGRYAYQGDDWEVPDTQVICWQFDNRTSMTWEDHSCNPHKVEGESVGVAFFGEKGTLVIGGGNSYRLYDEKDTLVKDVKSDIVADPTDTMNPSEKLDAFHFQNFFRAIRQGETLRSGIVENHKSNLLIQLGIIAQRLGRSLKIDHSTGRILGDAEAMSHWSRVYEKGWEVTV